MYKEEIDAYIDSKKDEMLEDLEKLVRIDSRRGPAEEGKPYGKGPARAVAEAQKMMQDYGLTVKNYDNYVVTGDLSDAPKCLDILAHLDEVPVTNDWTVTDPFEPKIVDGRIYGRGTSDDKGPAIAALYALRAIRDLDIPMKKSVRLILGSDEECGSSDLEYYYSKEEEAPYSFTPDADFPLINIEKGRFEAHFSSAFEEESILPRVKSLKSGDKANVVPAKAETVIEGLDEACILSAAKETEKETGVNFVLSRDASDESGSTIKIDAFGKAAHAMAPSEGKNALTASLRLLSKLPLSDFEGHDALMTLNRLFPYEDTSGEALGIYREDEITGAVTLCFSILEYSPKELKGTFDSRLPIGCTDKNTRLKIMNELSESGIVLGDDLMLAPHCVSGDSDFVKILLDCYELYTGKKGTPLSTGGGTYVHNLKRGVAFGCAFPEVDNHMHGDDEFMEIDTLLMSAKMFANAAVRISNELE